MEEMGKMKIIADDGKIYVYFVDKNPCAFGYSMATLPITEKIASKICVIDSNGIASNELQNELDEEAILPFRDTTDLIGKYYDKDGYIYYSIDKAIYRYKLRLKYFREMYKSKINGA